MIYFMFKLLHCFRVLWESQVPPARASRIEPLFLCCWQDESMGSTIARSPTTARLCGQGPRAVFPFLLRCGGPWFEKDYQSVLNF